MLLGIKPTFAYWRILIYHPFDAMTMWTHFLKTIDAIFRGCFWHPPPVPHFALGRGALNLSSGTPILSKKEFFIMIRLIWLHLSYMMIYIASEKIGWRNISNIAHVHFPFSLFTLRCCSWAQFLILIFENGVFILQIYLRIQNKKPFENRSKTCWDIRKNILPPFFLNNPIFRYRC